MASQAGYPVFRHSNSYGIWLCKDWIAVQSVNDWLVGFGSGSNSFTLLHGFVNCQRLKLTANRGSVANTDTKISDELKKAVQQILDEINNDLGKNGIYTLFQWQSEERTLKQEKADFEARTKSIVGRRVAKVDMRSLVEPRNESELFGLFMTVQTLKPDLFEFEPLDYNTSRGIDIVGRNKSDNKISESDFWYIELKYLLKPTLNHGFKYLRWIVCWDFDRDLKSDTEFTDIQETEIRNLDVSKGDYGETLYFLNAKKTAVKIQVIRLKELLKQRLGIEFSTQ